MEQVIIRYDGPALAGHKMDVGDLAPALLGLSELCKIANSKFNGDGASVKVLISVDEEQKCFQFAIDIVQFLGSAQTMLDHQSVKTAKEILDFIGIAGGAAGAIYGLLKFLKFVKSKPESEVLMQPTVVNGQDVVQVSIEGNNNQVLLVWPETISLWKDQAAVEQAKRVVEPATKEGYTHVEFEQAGKVTERVSSDDALAILEARAPEPVEVDLGDPQTVTAYVQVYAPVYDPKADSWRFMYNGGHPYMDISETDIAKKAFARGGALMNDTYKVQLEFQQTKSTSGSLSARYKIKKVLEFHPARLPYQHDFIAEPEKKRDEEPPLLA